MGEGNADMVEIEKTRLNLFNVGGLLTVLVVNVFGLGALYNQNQNNDQFARGEIGKLTIAVTEMKSQIPELKYNVNNLTIQAAENKANIVQTNERIGRIVDSIGGKLDTIGENVNRLSTRVEVLASRIGEKVQPTRLRVP